MPGDFDKNGKYIFSSKQTDSFGDFDKDGNYMFSNGKTNKPTPTKTTQKPKVEQKTQPSIKEEPYVNPYQRTNAQRLEANKRAAKTTFGAAVQGFADTATLGLASRVSPDTKEALSVAEKAHPIATTVGKVAGYVIPGEAAVKGTQLIGKGLVKAGAKAVENKLVRSALTGSGSGAILGGAETAIRGGSKEDIAKNAVLYGAGGAILNPAIDLALSGLAKGAKALFPKAKTTESTIGLNRGTGGKSYSYEGGNIPKTPAKPVTKSIQKPVGKPQTLTNRFNPSDTTLMLDSLKKSGMPKEEVVNEIKGKISDLEKEMFDFLKVNKNGTKNYDRGAIKHPDGSYTQYSVTDNPEWYSEFYKNNKKRPTIKDLQSMSKRFLEKGFKHYGDIPANEQYNALKQELQNIESSKAKQIPINLATMPTTKVFTPKSEGLKLFEMPVPKALKGAKGKSTKSTGLSTTAQQESAVTAMDNPIIPTTPTNPITPSTGNTGKQKVSKFFTNSLQQGNALSEEGKNALEEVNFLYGVKANKDSLNRAESEVLKNGVDSEISRLTNEGINSAEDAMGLLITSKDLTRQGLSAQTKSEKDEVYSKMNDLMRGSRPDITNSAQILQALNQFKKTTPEGAVMTAHSVVENVVKAIKEQNPAKMKQSENMIARMSQQLDDVDREIPLEELLSSKISSTLKESTIPANDVEKNMINQLFKIAKQDLPQQTKNIKDPLQFVSEAIKNRNQYQDVWNKAKSLLQEKYSNDPEKLSMLEDYFNKTLRPVYDQGKLNQAIQQQLKEKGINLNEIVRQHYSIGSSVRNDLKQTLIEKAGLTGQDAEYLATQINNRMKELTKSKKEQILKQMFKNKPTPTQKSLIDKITEMQNLGAMKNNNYKNLVYEKLGIPTLSDADTQAIVEAMNRAQSLTGRAKEIEVAKAMKVIGDKIPATIAQKVQAFQRMSLLLNTKTMIRNIAGNVILGGLENVKDVVATPIDIATSAFTKQRTTALPNLGIQAKGLARGAKETAQDVRLGIDTTPFRGQYDLPVNKFNIHQTKIFDNKILNALDKATKVGLQLGDRPFYQAAFDDNLSKLMKLAKTDVPTDDMIEKAIEVAKDRTFQNESDIAKGMEQLQRGLNSLGKKFGVGNEKFGLGTFTLPFPKTPGNILDKAIDYSPTVVLDIASKAIQGKLTQKVLVDKLGRGITGSGLIKVGYELAKKGLLTGKPNDDKDVAMLEKQTGKSPYSIKNGNEYMTIDWAQPSAVPLMIGADLYHGGKSSKQVDTTIIDAIKSGGETLMKQGVLQGIQRLFGGNTPLQGFEDVAKSIPAQFAPSAMKMVAQFMDDVQRETYSPSKTTQSINMVTTKIPNKSKELYPKVDTLGREVKNYQGKSTPFNVMFNPSFTTKDKSTPGEKMILDIYNASGDKSHFPRVVEKKIRGMALTSKQYYELQKLNGQLTNKLIQKLASNKEFNKDNMTEKEAQDRSKVISQVLTDIYTIAKMKTLPKEYWQPKNTTK